MPDNPPDRLSALIQHFRIEAKVLAIGKACGADLVGDRPAPNLFVVRHGQVGFLDGRLLSADREGPTLVFFPRGAPPALEIRNQARDAEYVCASVDTGGDANPFALALPDAVSAPIGEAGPLQAVADMLLDEALAPRCGSRAVIDRLCEILVIRLLRHLIESGRAQAGLLAGLAHPNLARAIVAMHDMPDRTWRLVDLAEIAGMSRTHFVNRFRDVVGITPAQYLSDWRLTLARIEIAKGTPVKLAAGRVGFSSSAALSRAFTRRFGVSPTKEQARPA